MAEKCLFCEREAVATIELPGTKGDNRVCERHYIIMSEKMAGKDKPAPKDEPRTIPPTPAKRAPSDFTRVKLTPLMQEHLDHHFSNRPDGIRSIIKKHMKGTKPMTDPQSEKIRWFLVELYRDVDGEITSFEEILMAVRQGFSMNAAAAGKHVNNIMKERYLWRLPDGRWKIGPEKRDFSSGNPLAELFG